MFGRYELLNRIGTGGMAEVWRARVGGVGGFEKIVVVKKILPAFAQNKTFIDMLLTEAGVSCLSGTAFGRYGDGFLRVSYANSLENIEEALARIRRLSERWAGVVRG